MPPRDIALQIRPDKFPAAGKYRASFPRTQLRLPPLFQTVSVAVSVLTLTFISIDRWYAICFPLKFKSTTGRAKTAIGIIWLLALAFGKMECVWVSCFRYARSHVAERSCSVIVYFLILLFMLEFFISIFGSRYL